MKKLSSIIICVLLICCAAWILPALAEVNNPGIVWETIIGWVSGNFINKSGDTANPGAGYNWNGGNHTNMLNLTVTGQVRGATKYEVGTGGTAYYDTTYLLLSAPGGTTLGAVSGDLSLFALGGDISYGWSYGVGAWRDDTINHWFYSASNLVMRISTNSVTVTNAPLTVWGNASVQSNLTVGGVFSNTVTETLGGSMFVTNNLASYSRVLCGPYPFDLTMTQLDVMQNGASATVYVVSLTNGANIGDAGTTMNSITAVGTTNSADTTWASPTLTAGQRVKIYTDAATSDWCSGTNDVHATVRYTRARL